MTHSHSQRLPVACSECGQWFAPEVWLIIDADERPAWMSEATSGAVRRAVCPHCGRESTIDAPLLVYRPGRATPLLHDPASWMNKENYDEVEDWLVGRLLHNLGVEGRPEWSRWPVYLPLNMMDVFEEDEEAELFSFAQLLDKPNVPIRLSNGQDAFAPLLALARYASAVASMHPAVAAVMTDLFTTLQSEGVVAETEEELEAALLAHPELRARLETAERLAEESGVAPYGNVG